MKFQPNRIRIAYIDGSCEVISLDDAGKAFGEKVNLTLRQDESGIITPIIAALDDICPGYLNIEFDIPEDALGDDLYYYYATFTTNDIASVFKHKQKPKNDMKDLFLAKNVALGKNFNIGLFTYAPQGCKRYTMQSEGILFSRASEPY